MSVESESSLLASYLFHSCVKGIQGGLLLGCGIGYFSALFDYVQSIGNRPFEWKKLMIYMKKLALIGVLFSCGLASCKIMSFNSLNKEEIHAFLNQTNENPINYITVAGMIIGSTLNKKERLEGCLKGGLFSFSISCLFYGLILTTMRIKETLTRVF